MSVITIWDEERTQTGKTLAAVALGTQMAIKHNIKILLVSTSYNDYTMKECFWAEKKQKNSIMFGTKPQIEQNGIEGLDKIIRSNKVSASIIPDYTKTVLTGRLDVLLGMNGIKEKYEEIQQEYQQIITMANSYYDIVIVDLDKEMKPGIKKSILQNSDIVLAFTSQKPKSIQYIYERRMQRDIINPENSIIVLGKYDENLKYNAKNISRNILRQKEIVNTIPYNTFFFQVAQEGEMIDFFLKLLKVPEKDSNYVFESEITRLIENINSTLKKKR